MPGAATILLYGDTIRRIAEALPGARLALTDELGMFDLVEGGMTRGEAELEVVVRALAAWRVDAAAVPPELSVGVADRVRAAGVERTIDAPALQARRRAKTPAELEGIRRAPAASRSSRATSSRWSRGSRAWRGSAACASRTCCASPRTAARR